MSMTANQADAGPGDTQLIVMHSALQRLYRVDPASDIAAALPVGAPLSFGDGLELRGSTL